MKKLLVFLLVLTMICPILANAASASEKKLSGTLTIYTALPDGEWPYYINAFQKETGITVNCLRLSAGEMVTRVVAEKDNPQASVMFGGSSDNYIPRSSMMSSRRIRRKNLPMCLPITSIPREYTIPSM